MSTRTINPYTSSEIELIALARRMKVEGYPYIEIATALGVTQSKASRMLLANVGKKLKGALICARCKLPKKLLHHHHDNYEDDTIRRLCPSCHTKTHQEWLSKNTKIAAINRKPSRRKRRILDSMAAKLRTKIKRARGYVLHGPLDLTTIELAQKQVLEEEFKKAKGNIALTAREIKWSRTKTLEKLKAWQLYDLFKHKPGPFKKHQR